MYRFTEVLKMLLVTWPMDMEVRVESDHISGVDSEDRKLHFI